MLNYFIDVFFDTALFTGALLKLDYFDIALVKLGFINVLLFNVALFNVDYLMCCTA